MSQDNDSSHYARAAEARAKSLTSDQRKEIARKAAAARWNLPAASHDGSVNIAGWLIPCYNLYDGRRVISQRGFMDIIDMRGRKDIGHRIGAIIENSSLKSPKLSKLVLDTQSPIKFLTPNGVLAFGYEGNLIVEFCKAILEMRRSKALPDYAQEYADAAEKFIIALAGVAIVALIDAATGYEKVRDRKELEALLDRYLRHEFSAWAKRFPDKFYQEIFRLHGWQWKGMNVNRPSCVGHFTNDLIYARVEIGLLKELQIRNPWIPEKKSREGYHHTLLTEDFGVPALAQHMHTVLTIMGGFQQWEHFKEFLDRTLPRKGESVQELLKFYEDDFLKEP